MDTIGFQFTYLPQSLPLGIALDLYGNGNENNTNGLKTETTIGEINLGLRWEVPIFSDSLKPFIGAGVSIASTELQTVISNTKRTYEDTSTGYWVGGGIDYIFTQHWSVGFDAHYSSIDVTLNGDNRDAGGLTLGATVGYHF